MLPYCAMVFRNDRYWLAPWRRDLPVTMHQTSIVPRDLRELLDRASGLFAAAGAGVVILDVDPQTAAGYKTQTARRQVDGGWRYTDGAWTGWETFSHPKRASVHVGLLRGIDRTKSALFDVDEDGGTIAERLGWYHDRFGGPWFMTGGVSGCKQLRDLYSDPAKGKQPYWGTRDRQEHGAPLGAGDLLWQRRLTEAERGLRYVHLFDLNAARLSAANVADLPWWALQETGPRRFDPALAGYWLLRAGCLDDFLAAQHPEAPPWFPPRRIIGGEAWLTTPIVKQLVELGVKPDVLGTRIAESQRWAMTWANTVNSARLEAVQRWGRDSHQFRATSATYTATMGMWASQGGSIYLPAGAHTVIDRQRVTLLRHVDRGARAATRKDSGPKAVSRYPFRVHTDCLWYASNLDWTATAETLFTSRGKCPIDPIALGKFKSKGTLTMDEFDELHARAARGAR